MKTALTAKFSQRKELKKLLLDTGYAILVEHAPLDPYWGDGGNGTGLNMLGKLLMEVRNELRNNTGKGSGLRPSALANGGSSNMSNGSNNGTSVGDIIVSVVSVMSGSNGTNVNAAAAPLSNGTSASTPALSSPPTFSITSQ